MKHILMLAALVLAPIANADCVAKLKSELAIAQKSVPQEQPDGQVSAYQPGFSSDLADIEFMKQILEGVQSAPDYTGIKDLADLARGSGNGTVCKTPQCEATTYISKLLAEKRMDVNPNTVTAAFRLIKEMNKTDDICSADPRFVDKKRWLDAKQFKENISLGLGNKRNLWFATNRDRVKKAPADCQRKGGKLVSTKSGSKFQGVLVCDNIEAEVTCPAEGGLKQLDPSICWQDARKGAADNGKEFFLPPDPTIPVVIGPPSAPAKTKSAAATR